MTEPSPTAHRRQVGAGLRGARRQHHIVLPVWAAVRPGGPDLGGREAAGRGRRWRKFCHFADTPFSSILKHLLKGGYPTVPLLHIRYFNRDKQAVSSKMTELSPTARPGRTATTTAVCSSSPARGCASWRTTTGAATPQTWTILQKMALITSDYGIMRSLSIKWL